jgi:hypothetical protein
VFTVPLLAGSGPSRAVAERRPDGTVVHHEPPVHHGSASGAGALVTWHWGYDLAERVLRAGLPTTIVLIDDVSRGIRAELNEVLVSRRPPA